jgi:multicomponent Na+:H+ antiporter subunit F
MTPDIIVEYASVFAIVVLVIALLITVYRAVIGPTLPDRVIALDMLVGIVIGFIAVIALRTGYTLYIDIAIALGLVGFLATVAFARFILARGVVGEGEQDQAAPQRATSGNKAMRKPAKTGKTPRSSVIGKEIK